MKLRERIKNIWRLSEFSPVKEAGEKISLVKYAEEKSIYSPAEKKMAKIVPLKVEQKEQDLLFEIHEGNSPE
jgi:hypothetical protein